MVREIVALIVARNEEEHIFDVISSLKNQTTSISKVVLVDDGSTDDTPKIGKDLGCIVITLPYHEESLVGTPELTERWNVGLKTVREYSPDYVLLMGGDHLLPKDYVQNVLSKMSLINSGLEHVDNIDEWLSLPDEIIIASGRIEGEGYTENAPRGSGRLVKAFFWLSVNNMQYPVSNGWESWLLFKAMERGYQTRCFREITSKIERPTSIKKAKAPGIAMYALGYNWKYAMGRCFVTFFKSPKAGLQMFWGWFRHKGVERLDVADYVNQMQNKRFWGRVWTFIKRGGRR